MMSRRWTAPITIGNVADRRLVHVAGYASGPVDLATGSLVTRSLDAFLARFARS